MRLLKPQYSFLLTAVLFCSAMSQAQRSTLEGFEIGMSRQEVCRHIERNSTRLLVRDGNRCPGLRNHVVVNLNRPEFPELKVLHLAFGHQGTLNAIWATFPSASFPQVRAQALRKYGLATGTQEYKPASGVHVPENSLFYWKTRTGDIILEAYNVHREGEWQGWISFNSPTNGQRFQDLQ